MHPARSHPGPEPYKLTVGLKLAAGRAHQATSIPRRPNRGLATQPAQKKSRKSAPKQGYRTSSKLWNNPPIHAHPTPPTWQMRKLRSLRSDLRYRMAMFRRVASYPFMSNACRSANKTRVCARSVCGTCMQAGRQAGQAVERGAGNTHLLLALVIASYGQACLSTEHRSYSEQRYLQQLGAHNTSSMWYRVPGESHERKGEQLHPTKNRL